MKSASPDVETCARQVRELVARRQYAAARTAFEDYCRLLRDALTGLRPSGARRQLYENWQHLYSETRQHVLAGRAHAAARLAHLRGRGGPYHETPAAPPTWRYLA